ncbi:MAG: TM1802 family CRISPR-associated protein, partial [Nitrososphaeria archaeon]
MFYSLLRIGRLTGELPFEKVKGEGDLCIVVFNADKRTIEFERYRLGQGDEEKYAYIKDADTRKPQICLTTKYPDRIFGFYVNKKDGKSFPSEKFALREVAERLKGRPIGDLLKNRVLSWYDPDKYKDDILKRRNEWDDCKLYTVKIIDGGKEIYPTEDEEYRRSLFYSGELEEGVCQFCGKNMVLKNPDYPNGTLLKIFIVDKKGFLPGLSEDAISIAHSVCPECRLDLIKGDYYVERNLRSRIRNINVYVIPEVSERSTRDFIQKFSYDEEGYILANIRKIINEEQLVQDIS